MLEWGGTLAKARVLAGVDANEVFTDPDGQGPRAHTGRGEAILASMAAAGASLHMQDLPTPTYHPHNTQQRSRRLDYRFHRGVKGGVTEGSRHMASSDHDLAQGPPPPSNKPTWGKRRYVEGADPAAAAKAPLQQTDTHHTAPYQARQDQRQIP